MADEIVLTLTLGDKKGQMIPHGVVETLTLVIVDGSVTFWFKDPKTTKRFVMVGQALEAKNPTSKTVYLERLQKANTQYTGKTKEEIKELLLKAFSSWGAKIG